MDLSVGDLMDNCVFRFIYRSLRQSVRIACESFGSSSNLGGKEDICDDGPIYNYAQIVNDESTYYSQSNIPWIIDSGAMQYSSYIKRYKINYFNFFILII